MKRASISTLIPLFLIAACSGGDSSSNDANDNPVPTSYAITPGNGLQVAQVAYGSVVASGDMAGLTGSTGLTAGSAGGLSKPEMDAQIGGVLGRIMQKILLAPVETICGSGPGKVTVTFDVVDPLVLASGAFSAGDTILVEYVNCDEGFGEVIDGTIDFIVDAFTGNIVDSAYDVTMTAELMNFQVTTSADALTSNGDATASLNTLVPSFASASVSGNMMTTDTNSSSEVLTAYTSSQTVNAGLDPAPYTMNASGTLDSSQLTGTITYLTEKAFEGFDVNYPNKGELLVSAESGSARLVAQINGVDVHIEIYSNTTGTGTPDQTIMTTWAELTGT